MPYSIDLMSQPFNYPDVHFGVYNPPLYGALRARVEKLGFVAVSQKRINVK